MSGAAGSELLADLRRVSATSEDPVPGALAQALPGTPDEVAAVLAVARAHRVGVTVRGGGTGQVGGADPDATLLLSTRRLDRVGPVEGGCLVAGAGVTLAQAQDRARRGGWDYAVDLPTRGGSTVGGTVATDAGGVHVVAHGTTRAQVLGLEAVLADGTVLRGLGGPVAGTAGSDLAPLLVGAEGTLGVITAVRLRLVARTRSSQAALVGCASVAGAVALAVHVRTRVPSLRVAELLLADGLALVRPDATSAPAWLLLEADGGLEAALRGGAGVLDVELASEPEHVSRLWGLRTQLPDAVAAAGAALVVDAAVPPARLAELVEGLQALLAGAPVHAWARAVTGGVHVAVLDHPDPPAAEDAVLRRVAELGGSVGGERGVGRRRRPWLPLVRPPAGIAAARALKAALDPDGVLNPGVLLP